MHVRHNDHTDAKSKSSTPNLEYAISTLRYGLGILSELNSAIGVSASGLGYDDYKNVHTKIRRTHTSCDFPLRKRAWSFFGEITMLRLPRNSLGSAVYPMKSLTFILANIEDGTLVGEGKWES